MLTERQRSILKAVTETYIATGEPVGSKLLNEKYAFGVSSATLRNEMSELIAQGYLEQPHTSAGRVPTHKGYRLYVNELMNGYALTTDETAELKTALKMKIDHYDRLTEEVGRVLSQLTEYAAVTVAPRLSSGKTIRRIDCIPCDGDVCVLIVVLGNGIVKDKVITVSERPDNATLAAFLATANGILVGLEPAAVTIGHIHILNDSAGDCSEIMVQLVEFLNELSDAASEMNVATVGESRLLSFPEYRDPETARELFGFLKEGSHLDWLPTAEEGVPVVRIGSENGDGPLRNSSVIMAACNLGNGYRGYIGIVGPTRMQYSRLSARLAYFAKGLSALLADDDGLKLKGDDSHEQE